MDDEDPVRLFMAVDSTDPDDFPLSSQDSQSLSSSSDTYMLGFVIANIVGIQYYSGTISSREMVGLVREPLNPYDSNAIKVLNTRTFQVGHIERTAATALAPLFDSNLIAVEGIAPNTRAKGNRFKIPCQVHIFARLEDFPSVESAISESGLQLISDSHASFTLSEAVVVKEKKAEKGCKSVDEIFKLVDENASQNGALEALEPPKATKAAKPKICGVIIKTEGKVPYCVSTCDRVRKSKILEGIWFNKYFVLKPLGFEGLEL